MALSYKQSLELKLEIERAIGRYIHDKKGDISPDYETIRAVVAGFVFTGEALYPNRTANEHAAHTRRMIMEHVNHALASLYSDQLTGEVILETTSGEFGLKTTYQAADKRG